MKPTTHLALVAGPGFVKGRGERAHDCRSYEQCLQAFTDSLRRLTRAEVHGHCPAVCSGYQRLTREDEWQRTWGKARGWAL